MAFVDAVLGSGRAGRITMQEMRMGTRRRQQAQPRCGREFLAVISALGGEEGEALRERVLRWRGVWEEGA